MALSNSSSGTVSPSISRCNTLLALVGGLAGGPADCLAGTGGAGGGAGAGGGSDGGGLVCCCAARAARTASTMAWADPPPGGEQPEAGGCGWVGSWRGFRRIRVCLLNQGPRPHDASAGVITFTFPWHSPVPIPANADSQHYTSLAVRRTDRAFCPSITCVEDSHTLAITFYLRRCWLILSSPCT